MKISAAHDAAASRIGSLTLASELEEIQKLRKESDTSAEEAVQKVQEAQQANTQSTMKMMDRHNDMVKKSQELAREQEKKRAVERLAQERSDEHTEILAEVALRNAERRDLLEVNRLKG